jgi:hypothetical protein
VVTVRLSGLPADIAAVAALLAEHAPAAGIRAGSLTAPRPNRRDPGIRVYLTMYIPPAEES